MKFFNRCSVLLLLTVLTGCASTINNPQDPLEGFNRTMFNFNDKIDQVALKPAATAYKAAVPSFAQTGVGNFFGNIGDVANSFNNFGIYPLTASSLSPILQSK